MLDKKQFQSQKILVLKKIASKKIWSIKLRSNKMLLPKNCGPKKTQLGVRHQTQYSMPTHPTTPNYPATSRKARNLKFCTDTGSHHKKKRNKLGLSWAKLRYQLGFASTLTNSCYIILINTKHYWLVLVQLTNTFQ